MSGVEGEGEGGGQVMERCDQCLFWKMARPGEGRCLRRAPKPVPEVRSDLALADDTWRAGLRGIRGNRRTAFDFVLCGQCRYWRKPAAGLQPIDRGDKPSHWWAQAGLCTRHAPTPVSEPGPRAFWRASHVAEFLRGGLAASQKRRRVIVAALCGISRTHEYRGGGIPSWN